MELLTTIVTAMVTSGIVTFVLSWIKESKAKKDQRRWEIKREACLEALDIIDTRFADYQWGGDKRQIDKQDFIPTADIRSCFNRLSLLAKMKKFLVCLKNVCI